MIVSRRRVITGGPSPSVSADVVRNIGREDAVHLVLRLRFRLSKKNNCLIESTTTHPAVSSVLRWPPCGYREFGSNSVAIFAQGIIIVALVDVVRAVTSVWRKTICIGL